MRKAPDKCKVACEMPHFCMQRVYSATAMGKSLCAPGAGAPLPRVVGNVFYSFQDAPVDAEAAQPHRDRRAIINDFKNFINTYYKNTSQHGEANLLLYR